jgi:hypothetical protein
MDGAVRLVTLSLAELQKRGEEFNHRLHRFRRLRIGVLGLVGLSAFCGRRCSAGHALAG